jgi:hypothetical protein
MNGRLAKILICILCGALLLIAGCTTPAPPETTAQTPVPRVTVAGQATTSADLGGLEALLRSIDERLSVVVENTRPEGMGTLVGNIVLFDNNGDAANTITTGQALLALPSGSCDIVLFSHATMGLYVTFEEIKDIEIGKEHYYRNRQTCINEPMCRRTVQADDDFPFLYLDYRPYNEGKTLNRVTLSYHCKAA